MAIAFRVLSLVLLGGLVLLWYLDFEPRRLTALVDPLFRTSDQVTRSNDADRSQAIERRLEAIEIAVSSIAAGRPPPPDTERLDSRLAALGSRLTAIEETLSQAGTAPAAPDVSGLERQISALGKQVAALTESVSGPDLTALEARLGRIESSLADLAEPAPIPFDPAPLRQDIAEIDAKLETLVTDPEVTRRLAQVAARLKGLETRIAAVAERSPAGMAAAEIRDEFSRITERLETLAARPAPAAPENLGQRLTSIEEELARLSQTVSEPVNLAALSDRLEAIDSTMAAIAAEPALAIETTGLESELAALRSDMNASLQSLEAGIDALATQPAPQIDTGDLEARIAELADRLPAASDAVRNTLAEMREKLEALPARPAPNTVPQELSERLAFIEEQVAAIARRPDDPVDLSPVKDRLDALNTAMAAISARPAPQIDTGALQARIAELADRLPPTGEAAAIRTRLGWIEQTLDSLAARPVPNGTPGELRDRLAAIEQDLASLAGTLEGGPDMTAIEARLKALDAALTELAERPAPGLDASALESEMDSLETNLDARLSDLETGLARLAARPRPDLDTSALEARMAAVGARLGQIEARLSEADPSGLERQLAAIESRLDAFGEEITPAIDSAAIEARLSRIETGLARIAGAAESRETPEPAEPSAGASQPPAGPDTAAGVVIQTTGEAWMRIRDGRRIVFEGLVPGGQRVPVPSGLRAPELRAGNAGSVFILVDGVAYGPLGGPREVVRDVSLRAPDVRDRFPRATTQAAPGETAG